MSLGHLPHVHNGEMCGRLHWDQANIQRSTRHHQHLEQSSSLLLSPSPQAPDNGVASLPISVVYAKVNHGTFIWNL